MKYSIRKVPKGTTTAIPVDAWEVLKYPSVGDPYLIATFHHPSLARWTLSSLRGSMEVQRWGGAVEEMPPEPEESVKPPGNMPEELVW